MITRGISNTASHPYIWTNTALFRIETMATPVSRHMIVKMLLLLVIQFDLAFHVRPNSENDGLFILEFYLSNPLLQSDIRSLIYLPAAMLVCPLECGS